MKTKNGIKIADALKACAIGLSPVFAYDKAGELLHGALIYGMTSDGADALLDRLKAKFGWKPDLFEQWLAKHGFLYAKDAGSSLGEDGELCDL